MSPRPMQPRGDTSMDDAMNVATTTTASRSSCSKSPTMDEEQQQMLFDRLDHEYNDAVDEEQYLLDQLAKGIPIITSNSKSNKRRDEGDRKRERTAPEDDDIDDDDDVKCSPSSWFEKQRRTSLIAGKKCSKPRQSSQHASIMDMKPRRLPLSTGRFKAIDAPSSGSTNDDVNESSCTNNNSLCLFAGGWQSNSDLSDRKKMAFSILKVIFFRPDSKQISKKLPHMAKCLEEHLYRTAPTKEEYLDLSTLKQRLELVALGLTNIRKEQQKQLESQRKKQMLPTTA